MTVRLSGPRGLVDGGACSGAADGSAVTWAGAVFCMGVGLTPCLLRAEGLSAALVFCSPPEDVGICCALVAGRAVLGEESVLGAGSIAPEGVLWVDAVPGSADAGSFWEVLPEVWRASFASDEGAGGSGAGAQVIGMRFGSFVDG